MRETRGKSHRRFLFVGGLLFAMAGWLSQKRAHRKIASTYCVSAQSLLAPSLFVPSLRVLGSWSRFLSDWSSGNAPQL